MSTAHRSHRAPASGTKACLLVLAAIALGACSSHHVEPAHGHARKVYVCHKGKKTLEIADSALEAHLRHGDHRGPCGR